jgi:uncharacterized membrane protein
MPSTRRFLPIFMGAATVFALGMACIPEARAAMVFCNRTRAAIEAAIGYRGPVGEEQQKIDWVSEGWWQIEPDQCARVYGEPLSQRFYYYYATSLAPTSPDKSPDVWKGKYQFCTDTKAFRVEGDTGCEQRGYQTHGFQEMDVGVNTHDYTLDFHEAN